MLCLFVDACVCSVLLIVLDVLFLLPLMVHHQIPCPISMTHETEREKGRKEENPQNSDRDSSLSVSASVIESALCFFLFLMWPVSSGFSSSLSPSRKSLFLQCSKKKKMSLCFFFDDCRAYPNFVCRCFCSLVFFFLFFPSLQSGNLLSSFTHTNLPRFVQKDSDSKKKKKKTSALSQKKKKLKRKSFRHRNGKLKPHLI